MYKGVFWIITQNRSTSLLAFPFKGDETVGVAKSGDTFNHELLWNSLKPKMKQPFNYYPRGRVDFNSFGEATIYLSPCISRSWIPRIQKAFDLECEPKIRWDFSEHYKCYLDYI